MATKRLRSTVAVIKPLDGSFDEGAARVICEALNERVPRAALGLRQQGGHGPVHSIEVMDASTSPNTFKNEVLAALYASEEELSVEFKSEFVFQDVA